MDGLLLVLTPVAALALWGAISPRSQWKRLVAWGYRNPEANEPSDAAFALTRVGNIVLLAVLVWQVIGLATDGDDRGARPAATATSTAQATEQLRSEFGVTDATVVTPPVVTAPSTATGLVKIIRYQDVEAAAPPAYVAQALAGQTGTWLVLGVRADAPPNGVRVNEVFRGLVYVSVLDGCVASCPTEAVESGESFYLVLVRLDRPLTRRLVYDGATDRPVP